MESPPDPSRRIRRISARSGVNRGRAHVCASHRMHAAHLCACKREVRRHALQPHALRATLASGTKMAYSCGLPERRSCTARASGTGIGGRKPGHFFCSFTTRAMSMNASKRYSVSHGPPRACAGQRHAIPRHSAARSATRQRARSPAVDPSRDWPRLVEPSRVEPSRVEPSRAEPSRDETGWRLTQAVGAADANG